ncbi:MAG: DMT family transporter [Alcaligenaceae bacterium]|nr:DMT family transporter [Alcaligenaceae bacterium]
MHSLWMLLASFMFSMMGAGVKFVGELSVPLSLTIIARGLPSVLLIFVWAVLTGHSLKPKSYKLHFFRNLFGVTALSLVFYCYSVLPLATATTLNYTSALFIGLWLFIKGVEGRRDWFRFFTCILGFASVLLVLRPSLGEDQYFAVLLGLGSGISAAVAMMQIRSLGKLGESTWITVFYFSLVVTVTGLITFDSAEIRQISAQAWVGLLTVGLSGLVGQLCITKAYGSGSPILSAVLQYMTIVFSVFMGILFWDDVPDLLVWVGIAGVISAGALSAWATMLQVRKAAKLQKTVENN